MADIENPSSPPAWFTRAIAAPHESRLVEVDGCRVLAGSRVLLVADLAQDVLVVHPEHVVHAMLRDFHTTLAAGEADQ